MSPWRLSLEQSLSHSSASPLPLISLLGPTCSLQLSSPTLNNYANCPRPFKDNFLREPFESGWWLKKKKPPKNCTFSKAHFVFSKSTFFRCAFSSRFSHKLLVIQDLIHSISLKWSHDIKVIKRFAVFTILNLHCWRPAIAAQTLHFFSFYFLEQKWISCWIFKSEFTLHRSVVFTSCCCCLCLLKSKWRSMPPARNSNDFNWIVGTTKR